MDFKDQIGLTLVEVLVAAGISILIASTLGTALHQFIITSERGNDALRALHDVQNAGYWINRDGKGAEATNLVDGAPPAGSMTLNWTSGGQAHTSTFSLSPVQNSNGTIMATSRP